jgi:hypothetical protein
VEEDERQVVVMFQRLPLRRIQSMHWINLHQGIMNPGPIFMNRLASKNWSKEYNQV